MASPEGTLTATGMLAKAEMPKRPGTPAMTRMPAKKRKPTTAGTLEIAGKQA